jgi:hypothetical protein
VISADGTSISPFSPVLPHVDVVTRSAAMIVALPHLTW